MVYWITKLKMLSPQNAFMTIFLGKGILFCLTDNIIPNSRRVHELLILKFVRVLVFGYFI